MAYQTYQSSYDAAFTSAVKSSIPAPKPTITGIQEANIVSDWTKQRARGVRVPIEPPSLEPDGSIKVTSRMGRIDLPAGKRMAALEAAEAEKLRIAEEKKRAAEEKAAAIALAKAEKAAAAALAKAEKAGLAPAPEAQVAVMPAEPTPAEQPGLLGGVRKRMAGLFGG